MQPLNPILQAKLDRAAKLDAQRFGGNWGQPAAPIQTKLTIGAAGDRYEQEADRVAQAVVQRLDETGQNELPTKSLVQQPGEGAIAAEEELETAIQQTRGSGQPLAGAIRTPMEQAFGGADFSGVRVHTDAKSDALNQSIQAKAFTTGQDVFFRQGAYNPGSRGGQELIAHELTHVVQQNAVPPLQAQIDQPNPTKTQFGSEPLIQRQLMNPSELEKGAGKKHFRSIHYKNIVRLLTQYHRTRDQVTLNNLITACEIWLNKHAAKVNVSGTDRRWDAISTLKRQAKQEQKKTVKFSHQPPQVIDERPTDTSLDDIDPGFTSEKEKGEEIPPFVTDFTSLNSERQPTSGNLNNAEEKTSSVLQNGDDIKPNSISGEKDEEVKPLSQLSQPSSGESTYTNLENLKPESDFVDANVKGVEPVNKGNANAGLYKITFNFSVQKAIDGSLKKVEGSSTWFFKVFLLQDRAQYDVDEDHLEDYLEDMLKDIESSTAEPTEEEDIITNENVKQFKLLREQGINQIDWAPLVKETDGTLEGKAVGASYGIRRVNPRLAERNVAAYEIDQILGGDTIVASFIVDSLEVPGKDGKVKVRGLLMQGASGKEASEFAIDADKFDLKTQLAFSRLSLLDIILGQFDRHTQNFFIGEDTVTGIDNDLILGELFGKEMLNQKESRSVGFAGYYPKDLRVIDGHFANKIIQLDPDLLKGVLNKNFAGKVASESLEQMKQSLMERLEWLKAELNKEEIKKKFVYES
ncbi:MAG: DUF4157 domain-containing protein [Synechococcales bacterium]|nr:DUF4157 domain-containing protein [Synechococcales bacterium]